GIQFKKASPKPLLDLLPYELTEGQKNAVNDVYKDTVYEKDGFVRPMARIIVGDVGSGKTVVAEFALYFCVNSGYQAALMVPTEILARQHYASIKEHFDKLGYKTELLLGSHTQKEKKRIHEALRQGEVDIVIGTHSIISEKVEFKNLGLVITDEQHRFGVNQRALLKEKSRMAHVLVMSATPIPRTLALTMYGDLDVSRITEMPKGRSRVDTFVVNEAYRARLNDFIRKQVALGGQCYVVCPAIEGDSEGDRLIPDSISVSEMVSVKALNLKNATEYAAKLQEQIPEITVGCLHGKMKTAEKDKIMKDFADGKIQVLVSTTVIEVGVNVPNASLMVVENAERFGLSQLHQLRGRVGRGSRKSYCVLVSDINAEVSRARLEVMRTTYNGFEIAEKDLLLRGPGDFFSSNNSDNLRQSGGFEFKISSMCNDAQLLQDAFETAKSIVNLDPELERSENYYLKRELSKFKLCNSSTIS
ncbi:MAG: ATP-dependent DNA helicase RecG, partial [Clostridia bacterium]|nr:ATP-dependent DNA helicase RecG [Clostridia bacterium]